MIEVKATVWVLGDTDEQVDAVLRELLTPRKGVSVQVVEHERKAYER